MQLLSPTWILTDSLHKQIIRKQYLSPILFIMITTIYWAIATWPPLSVQFSYSVVSNSLQLHGHQALRHQASLSIANSQSLLKLMSIKSAMPSNHLIFCRPLLLPPSIVPSIRVFSNESVHIRWPKYWSFSFSISPSKEHPGLISFRMDWLDLLSVQGTLNPQLQIKHILSDLIFFTWCKLGL